MAYNFNPSTQVTEAGRSLMVKQRYIVRPCLKETKQQELSKGPCMVVCTIVPDIPDISVRSRPVLADVLRSRLPELQNLRTTTTTKNPKNDWQKTYTDLSKVNTQVSKKQTKTCSTPLLSQKSTRDTLANNEVATINE